MEQGAFAWSVVPLGRCSFGVTGEEWPGPHHCAQCAAFVARACEAFAAAVARGEYDNEGYTPAERRAQRRRRADGPHEP